MLKLQEKLFFRSIVRTIMLAILLVGGIGYHIWIIARPRAMEEIKVYSGTIGFYWQMYIFVFYFIVMLFLAYDYFREIVDADIVEVIQITKKDWKSSWMQVIVMLQWVALCAVMVFAFACLFFGLSGMLTADVVFYLMKLVLLYIVINGLIAILLGWLLARSVSKVIGYVCMILFSCMVSPMLTQEVGVLSSIFHELYNWLTVVLIMPQGLTSQNIATLFPVNFSLVARSLFWVFLFTSGIFICYKRKKWQIVVCVIGMIGMFSYGQLPFSYYCSGDAYGVKDSAMYDQMRYEINHQSVKNSKREYNILKYEMRLDMGRQMKASITLYPDRMNLEKYDMTLYHLYKVTKVTDAAGQALEYEREDDYLTIFSKGDSLEKICIEYMGGCANFYSNNKEIYLPGWFAYYPMPGYRSIYDNYEYVDNRFEEPLEFDIEILGAKKVFCDMKRIEKNHFVGESCGPTLLAGFIEEKILDNGVTCIYPYLDKEADPEAEAAQEYKNIVLAELEQDQEWLDYEEKYIVILPFVLNANIPGGVWKSHTTLSGIESWPSIASEMTRKEPTKEPTKEEQWEEAISFCVDCYRQMKEHGDKYRFIKAEINKILDMHGFEVFSDEEFKVFVMDNFGEEEWNRLTQDSEIGGE